MIHNRGCRSKQIREKEWRWYKKNLHVQVCNKRWNYSKSGQAVFPLVVSKHGNVSDFDFDLWDFCRPSNWVRRYYWTSVWHTQDVYSSCWSGVFKKERRCCWCLGHALSVCLYAFFYFYDGIVLNVKDLRLQLSLRTEFVCSRRQRLVRSSYKRSTSRSELKHVWKIAIMYRIHDYLLLIAIFLLGKIW